MFYLLISRGMFNSGEVSSIHLFSLDEYPGQIFTGHVCSDGKFIIYVCLYNNFIPHP
jgi:hypothetical protein